MSMVNGLKFNKLSKFCKRPQKKIPDENLSARRKVFFSLFFIIIRKQGVRRSCGVLS